MRVTAIRTQDAFVGADAITDNRPTAIECVHAVVTLIEKLDAITRRYARTEETFAPASFARHYEDVAPAIRRCAYRTRHDAFK